VDAGYASLFGDQARPATAGVHHLGYGLTDAFHALLEVDFSRHPNTKTSLWSSGIGVAYTLDVARAVRMRAFWPGVQVAGDLFDRRARFPDRARPTTRSIATLPRLSVSHAHIFAPAPIGTAAYATTFSGSIPLGFLERLSKPQGTKAAKKRIQNPLALLALGGSLLGLSRFGRSSRGSLGLVF